MKRLPRKFNSDENEVVLKLTTRCDKKGNIFYLVEFGSDYFAFLHLSSALDFIQSNFSN